MPANFSRYFVEAPGNTILADHYNGEFNNILNNLDPDGVDDASLNLSAFQSTVDPGELASESLPTALRGEIQRLRFAIAEAKFGVGTSRKWYESPASSNISEAIAAAVPIGTMIPFYDFNAGLTFDSSIWKYCDGSSQTVGSLGAQTLPDMSNRYLVGFGTEAGGDIDTAAWSTSVVGNASHQVNLQHTHTISGSTASGTTGITASHAHTHTLSSGWADITVNASTGLLRFHRSSDGGHTFAATDVSTNIGDNADSTGGNSGTNLEGTTDNPSSSTVTVTDGGHTHAVGTLANANSLSTTQSIQPRSVQVRWIIRVS
jgi:hypothetical protein